MWLTNFFLASFSLRHQKAKLFSFITRHSTNQFAFEKRFNLDKKIAMFAPKLPLRSRIEITLVTRFGNSRRQATKCSKEIEMERYTVEDAILCNPSNCKSDQHPISP